MTSFLRHFAEVNRRNLGGGHVCRGSYDGFNFPGWRGGCDQTPLRRTNDRDGCRRRRQVVADYQMIDTQCQQRRYVYNTQNPFKTSTVLRTSTAPTPTPTRTSSPTSSQGSSRECRHVVQLATGITSRNRACPTCQRGSSRGCPSRCRCRRRGMPAYTARISRRLSV